MKIRYIKIAPVIGFGYWKDVYRAPQLGITGLTHNIVLPFVRIQWGYLET